MKNNLVFILIFLLSQSNLKSADVSAEVKGSAEHKDKIEALSNAIAQKDVQKVDELLMEGINPNIFIRCRKGGSKRTPLHCATTIGDDEKAIEIVKKLIQAKADLNLVRKVGDRPPLLSALFNNNWNIAKLFISNGADVNIKDASKKQPIFYVLELGQTHHRDIKEIKEIIDLLLSKGANIDAQDDEGNTILMSSTNPEIVKLLLENGADYKIKNNLGQSFLDLASRNPKVLDAFGKFEADLASKSKKVCEEVMNAIPTFSADVANIVAQYVHSCPKE